MLSNDPAPDEQQTGILELSADLLERAAKWCRSQAARRPTLAAVPDPVEDEPAAPVEPAPVDKPDDGVVLEQHRHEAQSVSEAIARAEKQL